MAENLQLSHQSYKLLITGMSGCGKTTYWLRSLLGIKAKVKFVFDHKGEVALRLGGAPCFTVEELGQAVSTGWVIFNPARMFEGNLPGAFLFFCEWVYRVSCSMGGRKILACDELQQFIGPNAMPRELALCCEDGRLRGLDMVVISSQPNIIHNRVRYQITEAVAVRTEERNALDWLEERGFDPAQVKSLRPGEFICRDLFGRQTGGRVF